MAQHDALEISLHELDGTQIALIDEYEDMECAVALNDVRTGKAKVAIDSEPASVVQDYTLGTVLGKIRYRGKLAFHGYVGNPVWDLNAGTVELGMIGPELKLMHHYLQANDKPVTDGVYPQAGETSTDYGIFELIQAARLSQAWRDVGAPDNLITRGHDFRGGSATSPGPKYMCEPGDNVWERLQRMTDDWAAPDFEFEPIDDEHDPDDKRADAATAPLLWPRLPIVQMNLNRQNRGRFVAGGAFPQTYFQGAPFVWGDPVDGRLVFDYGGGSENVVGCVYKEDLSTVRNYARITAADREGSGRHWYEEASVLEIGMYKVWEASQNESDPDDVLDAIAQGQLAMFSYPEVTCELTLAHETHYQLHFLDDFIVGDFARVNARRGVFEHAHDHRIIGCTISRSAQDQPIEQKLDLAAALTESDATLLEDPDGAGDIGE